jgi:hypothetical protein
MRNRFFAILGTLGSTAVMGCLDADPSPFTPRDAGIPDTDPAGRDVATDVDWRESCAQCFRTPADPGPGCAEAYDACFANAQCVSILECGFVAECWKKTEQAEIITCGTPCALEAGVFNPADISVQLLTPIIGCALTVCHPACAGVP